MNKKNMSDLYNRMVAYQLANGEITPAVIVGSDLMPPEPGSTFPRMRFIVQDVKGKRHITPASEIMDGTVRIPA